VAGRSPARQDAGNERGKRIGISSIVEAHRPGKGSRSRGEADTFRVEFFDPDEVAGRKLGAR
jgi:hypothetical protein